MRAGLWRVWAALQDNHFDWSYRLPAPGGVCCKIFSPHQEAPTVQDIVKGSQEAGPTV